MFIFIQGLNLEQAKLVLDQLAAFHAASHHYVENYPGGPEGFKNDYEVLFLIQNLFEILNGTFL